ncbi:MAG: SGNH/GDSL hydrolase family protein [Puniceicoccales bacterium]|nr:SGNH/GDSL hydrolase family protein [Puniceicoccales bacterium]
MVSLLLCVAFLAKNAAAAPPETRVCDAHKALLVEDQRGRPAFVWHDAAAKEWRPEGRAWDDTPTPFARLSVRAKGKVPGGVWLLSQHSAGLVFRFKTDAPTVRVRVTTGGSLAMPHMTAVGVSGVDLYARGEDSGGAWRWAGATKPSAKHTDAALFDGAKPLPREFALYLPLYNNTVALAVGVPAGSAFETLPPRPAKPLVFYGTSILHGCSASRPGMTIPALLGRWLDTPTVNLGFSGNGRMETALADVLGEIDAAAYVLDCLPNMHYGMPPAEVERRTLAFVKRLREKRPTTPVVLVEDRTLGNAWLLPRLQREHKQTRAAYRAAYAKLVAGGVKGLRYIAGDGLIGSDDEATIDASHLTDLGMWRQAKTLLPVLREYLPANAAAAGCAAGAVR